MRLVELLVHKPIAGRVVTSGYPSCEVCGEPCYVTIRLGHRYWRHCPHFDPPARMRKPPRLGRTCAVCGIAGTPNNPVVPFGLRHARRVPHTSGLGMHSIATSAGSLALCNECWTTHAKPHMRIKRSETLRTG
jgi:hypothetical protein